MNRRVLVIVTVGLAVLAGAALMIVTRSRPAPAESARTPAAAPRPAAPRLAPPAPEPSPSTETATRSEPPRRSAAPAPAPASAPAPPIAELVTLHVDSDVPGAQVFVDRNFVGITPLTTTEVKAGAHRLNVSAPGYEGVAQNLDVAAGSQEVMVRLREVRLDATLDVIHKHRLGSCTGRLAATPQGLRYDTSDKDDAFRAALVDLETFEVDYLQKNLRVKPKQGKRFDFTDPEGNADRLFVFHRDVEKARARLKKGDPPAAP